MSYPVVAIRQPKRAVIYLSIREPIEVGRECDGLLLGDAQVSRRHLILDVEDGRVVVEDLGSTNGTTLEGLPIDGPVFLDFGDLVGLGHSTIELCEPEVDQMVAGVVPGDEAADLSLLPPPAPPAPPTHPRSRPQPTLSASDPPFAGAIPQPAEPAPASPPLGTATELADPPPPRVDPRSSIDLVASQVAQNGVDLNTLSTDRGTVTIVFSDIESSTERNMALGDQEWFNVLSDHNQLIRGLVARFNGTEVKNQGDGFMLSFPGARMALACMVEVQQELAERAAADPERGIRVRIGLHTGEVLVDDDGDLFGKHVVVAARIANLAAGGEILVSSLTKEITSSRGDVVFGEAREAELKGIDGSHTVYPVDWTTSLPD